ncbi:Ribokinase-like protein [Patellaria atrata CBS 101060]|uniref:Ribokinase-like protein n=1 Tax=Patellaria atrata CBS 101060 TaxID=1346257 RepID=A0A9P4S8M2_9PEZI|nr:Ribokinase-like protein [Patellaria atrata CBS 101060]
MVKRIITVGATYIDIILNLPHYPTEDSKLRAHSSTTRRGGNGPNTLSVLAQLLAFHVSPPFLPTLCSPMPEPDHPDFYLAQNSFNSHAGVEPGPISGALPAQEAGCNVDLGSCIWRDAPLPRSYILVSQETGSRTIVSTSMGKEMTVREFEGVVKGIGKEGVWWHFEGRIPNIALECMKLLRHRLPHARISVEIEKPGRDGLQAMAAEADVVFYSRAWAQDKGFDDPEGFLRWQADRTPKASLICCTWGADGAAALGLPSGEYRHARWNPPSDFRVVDSIGAGDTFIAGMLYCLTCHAEHWRFDDKLMFANELAGRKVGQYGFDGLGEQMKLGIEGSYG